MPFAMNKRSSVPSNEVIANFVKSTSSANTNLQVQGREKAVGDHARSTLTYTVKPKITTKNKYFPDDAIFLLIF